MGPITLGIRDISMVRAIATPRATDPWKVHCSARNYYAFLWAFNSSGGSLSNEVYFTTLKKP
jgi:hypothetical protein